MSSTLTPADLTAPVIPSNSSSDEMTAEQITQLAEYIGEYTAPVHCTFTAVTHIGTASFPATSPEFRDSSDLFNDFMTSPLLPELDGELETSPFDTPYSEFLTTPLVNDDAMLTSPLMDYIDLPLFGGVSYSFNKVEDDVTPKPAPATTTDFSNLFTISPATPALDSFDPSHLDLHHSAPTPPPRASTPGPVNRRTKATGIRKGVTPETLLNEDAPTQPRKYTTPSATSRKDLPEVFRRKRARSVAFADEEDQLDELPPNPTEQDLIEQKRRQNTVAARRSRKRKLEQFQNMEASRNEERQLKELWMNRSNVLLQLVRSMGVNYPDFPEDEPKYADA